MMMPALRIVIGRSTIVVLPPVVRPVAMIRTLSDARKHLNEAFRNKRPSRPPATPDHGVGNLSGFPGHVLRSRSIRDMVKRTREQDDRVGRERFAPRLSALPRPPDPPPCFSPHPSSDDDPGVDM